jgi:drug/metabolite transporter (DMT)-like permease
MMEITAVSLILACLAFVIHHNHVYSFSSTVLLSKIRPLSTFALQLSDTTDTTTKAVEKLTASPIATFSSETSVSRPQNQEPAINALTITIDESFNPQSEYQKGLLTIGFITLLFSSNSPILHAAFSSSNIHAPPVLLLNAAVSVVALVGLLLGGDSLESKTLQQPFTFKAKSLTEENTLTLKGGCELGLWKFLGTTANLYGLTLTTADHGALLIQLTTLIVPLVQGIQGIPIPRRIQVSVILALAGVICFSQDQSGTPNAKGDALCVLAAVFYATYDLRLFVWGKRLPAKRLITTKIGTQAILSVVLLLAVSGTETMEYISSADSATWSSIFPVVFWSGVAVNALAPFLQVGGQQAVGATRCQTIYASQPLWAAILSFLFLGETIGTQGLVGGTVFLVALFMAATAEPPDADCGEINCEI